MSKIKEGKIITFYSFKGGVGRTMALANVAFLAAMNGKKVLVMDWDLEAPGLAHYFRGLVEGGVAAGLKDSPGILDLAWEWSVGARAATSGKQADALIKRYEKGEPFRHCITSLIGEHLPEKAALDFIGVGATKIEAAGDMPYEDALAHISWADLIEREGGGLLFNSLRKWAKKNYDLILLDSRTGLSDVAGICTMQLPDAVALCFVLNRQNIEGTARVAAAIRAKRAEAVALYAVPMRLTSSSNETFEGSDARGHAIRELTRIGGFSRSATQEGFQNLGIPTANTVPYYETLAPLVSSDPAYDPLTLNYLRLGSQLMGEELAPPKFPPEWSAQVRRRLQPRHATMDYLEKLQDAEPSRAVEEVLQLLENVRNSETDELDEEYISALIKAASNICGFADEADEENIRVRTLDTLRTLVADDPEKWASLFFEGVSNYINSTFPEAPEQLALHEELDAVLAQFSTWNACIQRLENWREMAWLQIYPLENLDAAKQITAAAKRLLLRLQKQAKKLAPDQFNKYNICDIDYCHIRASIALNEGDTVHASEELEEGLAKLSSFTPKSAPLELRRIAFVIHERLARLKSGQLAAQHAVEAVRWGVFIASQRRIFELAKFIVSAGSPALALEFSELAFKTKTDRGRLGVRVGPFIGADFLSVLLDLALLIAEGDGDTTSALLGLAQATESHCQMAMRRRQAISPRAMMKLISGAAALLSHFEGTRLRIDDYPSLKALATATPASRKRATDNGDSDDD